MNIATASEVTDAPHNTVVVENRRNPYLRKKQKLNLAAWNVRTTNDSVNSCRPERATAIISKELETARIDICALSEVRRERTGNIVEKDYTIYWSGGNKKEAGVGFAISNRLSNVTLDLLPVSDRIMVLRLQLKSGEFLKLVSVYGPTMQRSNEEKEHFYESLNTVVNANKQDQIIVLGDFNARVGCDWELWPNVLGKHGIGKMNSSGLILLEFCTQNRFTVMGSKFQLRNQFKSTWQHPRSKHWHQLDHVIANKSAKLGINVVKANIIADCFTDHRLIVCTCSFSLKKKKKGEKPPVKPTITMTSEKIDLLQGYLNEKLPECSYTWESFKETLQNAATNTFEKRKKQNSDWFDENDTEIQKLLKDKHLNRREIQKKIRAMKNDWFTRKAKEAETFHLQKKQGEFHATIREVYGPRTKNTHQVRSKQGQLLITSDEIKDRWVEHFSDLLNITTETDESVLDELDQLPVKEELDHPITERELDMALKRTKLGKSPGPDGILPEVLVHGGLNLKKYLFALFTIFWSTETLPADFLNPNLTIIFKKGDRSDCGNYRGISLLSTVGKVLADIILQRLQFVLPDVYPESQHGYRSGRGTIDGIFTVRQLMEKTREQRCNLYIAFIDFTKAFDTVNRQLLFSILGKIGCPPKLIRLIKSLYTDVKARLIIDGDLSKLFDYNGGVKQGCKLAPTLYGIYAAILLWIAFKDIPNEFSILIRFRTDGDLFDLKRLKAKTKVFYEYIREAQYADDIAVMSGTAHGLQTLLSSYNETSKRLGLRINAKKTEVMCIGPESDFFVDEIKLKNVERFKYLGSYMNRACNLKAEITARIQATSNAYYSLKQRVFDNHDLSINTKISVYKQCLLPILLYGSETWTLYAHEVKQLRTVQQRHLRLFLKIRWNDFVSNEAVLVQSNIEDIEILLVQNRLRWLGHVSRMENNRTVKTLLYGELAEGSRSIGRPKLRFKDNCKSILKAGNFLRTWSDTVNDRAEWRSTIKSVSTTMNNSRKEKYERAKEKRKK